MVPKNDELWIIPNKEFYMENQNLSDQIIFWHLQRCFSVREWLPDVACADKTVEFLRSLRRMAVPCNCFGRGARVNGKVASHQKRPWGSRDAWGLGKTKYSLGVRWVVRNGEPQLFCIPKTSTKRWILNFEPSASASSQRGVKSGQSVFGWGDIPSMRPQEQVISCNIL